VRLVRRLRDERGVVSVIMAMVIASVAIPLMATTVDVGMLFVARSAQQNAADQAAKAAAWAACNGRDAASAGTASLSRNGYSKGAQTSLGTVAAAGIVSRGSGSYGATIDVDVNGAFSPAIGVNTSRVSVRAAATCQTQTIASALYTHGSCIDSMDWVGNYISITGAMHTNGQLNILGNSIDVNGAVTYVTGSSVVGIGITWTPAAGPTKSTARNWPLSYNIADFDNSPAGQYSTRSDYVSAGSADIDNSWLSSRGYLTSLLGGTISSKIYYTDGNINISGSNISGNATFVARGTIMITAITATIRPQFGNLNAFSNKGNGTCGTDAILLSGSHLNLYGIQYAPNGRVALTGDHITTDGTIAAYQMQIIGNYKTVRAGAGSTTPTNPFVSLDAW
jgi:hypothetical protein